MSETVAMAATFLVVVQFNGFSGSLGPSQSTMFGSVAWFSSAETVDG